MSLKRAQSLLLTNKKEIATAVRAQVVLLAPMFKKIDRDASITSTEGMLDALAACLQGEGRNEFLKLVLGLARLRELTGMPARELVVTTHCYLPVCRRVFMMRSPYTLEETIEAYNEFESIALPLMAEVCRGVLPEPTQLAEAETLSDGRARLDLTPVPFDIG